MKRGRAGAVSVSDLAPVLARAGEREARPAAPAQVLGLQAVTVETCDPVTRTATVRVAGRSLRAILDDAVDPVVVQGASARGERVIAQVEDGEWVIIGALRTRPTPGIDRGDEYTIEARRVRVVADHEFAVVSGAASLVVRAVGLVETLAENITSRAAGVHKIIGRFINLN